ncbi:MAG: ABC transporter ATP-binding protein [Desulfosarcina sp.]|jgi:NitT/TauT family transport system ATP-binding protein
MTMPFRMEESGRSPYSARLTIRNLKFAFSVNGSVADILDDVSFDVAAGELVCILGPSGCGKTTLLKLIAGFMPPSDGQIKIDNRTVTGAGPDRCVVFQEDALFPWLTVAENIAFGTKGIIPRSRIDAEVRRYLELVGLSAFKDYLPREISGGMKQRVALARVLILKPQVLLMDEPFGALDAQTREEMQVLLLSLWTELSHTIVFVTHDLTEAVTLADRILIMNANPSRIQSEILVPLQRPRKTESNAFHQFYRQLRFCL